MIYAPECTFYGRHIKCDIDACSHFMYSVSTRYNAEHGSPLKECVWSGKVAYQGIRPSYRMRPHQLFV